MPYADANIAYQRLTRFQMPSELLTQVTAKGLHMHGLAQLHQASIDLAACKYGEEIARIEAAVGMLRKSTELYKDHSVREHIATAESRLAKANKDNSIVYHETVPPFNRLPLLTRFLAVKATPLPEMSATPILGMVRLRNRFSLLADALG